MPQKQTKQLRAKRALQSETPILLWDTLTEPSRTLPDEVSKSSMICVQTESKPGECTV